MMYGGWLMPDDYDHAAAPEGWPDAVYPFHTGWGDEYTTWVAWFDVATEDEARALLAEAYPGAQLGDWVDFCTVDATDDYLDKLEASGRFPGAADWLRSRSTSEAS